MSADAFPAQMDDEEKTSLCERILSDLDNILKRDANIVEFDIIGSIDSICNKSPVVYVDHNLALEKWCIPHLYEYANKKMLQFKLNFQRSELYLIHQWTRILLLINPDLTTAWNLRREVIYNGVQTFLEDLKFTEIVLIRKPKCASLFSYREWLLNNVYRLNQEIEQDLIDRELQITLNASSRYARNYYAWSHRAWIFTIYLSKSSLEYVRNKIMDDLLITQKWLESHVSDYSCFQYRQCLFGFLYNLASKPSTAQSPNSNIFDSHIILNEFDLLNSLFPLYPEQESLLLHRRFLLNASVRWCPDQLEQLKQAEFRFYSTHILPNLKKNCTNSWPQQLLRRYLLYLKRNLNWSIEN